MARRLPPLNSLRAAEAAGRHLSFKNAAEELGVTPAAVSQQVRILEEFYGVDLFRRLTRALELTEAGEAAMPHLKDGFDRLVDAVAALQADRRSGTLTVSASPSIAAKWLVPRLDRFRAAHPDYDVRLDATDELVSFAGDGVDIALRYGRGVYRGLVAERLMEEVLFPVCSPALLERGPPLEKPEDLANHTLLHDHWRVSEAHAPDWRMWLSAAGVEGIDISRGPRFSLGTLTIAAAIEGQGVALASGTLVRGDLEAGRLVRPFATDVIAQTEFCYYVVYPEARAAEPKVRAFRDWLVSEAERQEDDLP